MPSNVQMRKHVEPFPAVSRLTKVPWRCLTSCVGHGQCDGHASSTAFEWHSHIAHGRQRPHGNTNPSHDPHDILAQNSPCATLHAACSWHSRPRLAWPCAMARTQTPSRRLRPRAPRPTARERTLAMWEMPISASSPRVMLHCWTPPLAQACGRSFA